ncbi:hypothetical protein LQ953_13310 [Sphingomonas sp. IC-56]|uniref:hypothetical protein n=1 Tax=Sphingomonas sp. IC-56 TaxID=2898529 RepID=UPI001E450BE8|nr:hypothetical protein [Sphingomonas sp. IC-56]MCD2324996.1 hypothetical protein [Sphingomonas sp. IC-56]
MLQGVLEREGVRRQLHRAPSHLPKGKGLRLRRVGSLLTRLWNYRTSSLWVWVPLWAFAILLLGGFLI